MKSSKSHLASLIDRSIRDIVTFELKNPKVGFVSINQVELNADNSLVKVYVSFLGDEHPLKRFKELESMAGLTRTHLAHKLNLRKVPEVRYVLDNRFYLEDKISSLLNKEEEDLKKMKKEED